MTTDLRERLRRVDPAPPEAAPPSGAVEAVAVLHEIERRVGMEPRKTTDQSAITSSSEHQEASAPQIERDQVLHTAGARSRFGSKPVLAGAAAFAAVVLAGAALMAVLTEGDTTPIAATAQGPAAIIEAYIEAYNANDIDGVMALFSEESVVIDAPLDPQASGQSRGLRQIRSLHRADMRSAADENAYTISNVEVSGNTVSWDHVWINEDGTEWCAAGHSAMIEDGLYTLI